MRKVIIIISVFILVTFFAVRANCQLVDWRVIYYSSSLNEINFFNQDKGIIAGQSVYYTTSDRGITWSLPNYNPKWNFEDISIVDSNLGYAVVKVKFTNGGEVIKTTNGGLNWSYTGSLNYGGINAVNFINSQTGFVASREGPVASGYGIRKTTNGGNSWTTVFYPPSLINDIYFVNENEGFAISGNMIFKSSNGGISWSSTYTNGGSRLCFVNSNTGFVLNFYQSVLKTTNGGANWNTTSYSGNFLDFQFLDENTGWASSTGSSNLRGISKTTNGGLNWIHQYTELQGTGSPSHDVNAIYMINDSTGWGVTGSGYTLNTINGGEQWKLDMNNFYLGSGSIFFTSDRNGWLSTGEKIYRTTNKGVRWSFVNSPGENLNDIFFINDYTGYVTSQQGVLYKTINSGSNWNSIQLSMNGLFKVKFMNANIGYITGENGLIYKTTNAGLNWTEKNLNATYDLGEVSLLSSDTIYITTDSNILLKTSNGGDSFSEFMFDPGFKTTSLYFLDNNTGWVSAVKSTQFTYQNVIVKTTNAGISWVTQYDHSDFIQNAFILRDVKFINQYTGYAISNGGQIIKSTNSGTNWVLQTEYLDYRNLKKIFVYNEDNVWISSSELLIYRGDINTVAVHNQNHEIPASFHLHQNYPNPFNPSTKIKFDIPKGAPVKLKIFDMLGREVAELVNEKLNAGVYEYEWSASGGGLPSGVYFYRLQAGEFIETRRMVLVK